MAQRGRQMGGKVSRQYRPHYIKNLQDMKIDFICVKLDLSKSTVAKLLSAALDALEVPDAAASMPGGV